MQLLRLRKNYISSLGNKLNDPQTGAKSYWSILNKYLQKKNIPLIPKICFNGTFITKICEKISLFNTFLRINVFLLIITEHYPRSSIRSIVNLIIFHLLKNEIISIIRSLHYNKAHGWDAISIRMIKMCDESIVFPLKLIFESALKFILISGKIPAYKKESKNLSTNYRPIF